jgi:hypothetical protein
MEGMQAAGFERVYMGGRPGCWRDANGGLVSFINFGWTEMQTGDFCLVGILMDGVSAQKRDPE